MAAPTPLTITQLKQNNYAVVAGDLAVAPVAMDNVNGNSFVPTGKEILLIQNTDGAGAHTFSITSVADPYGRTDSSLQNYSVPLSSIIMIEMSQLTGWQSGGLVLLTSSSALLKISVLRFT